MRWICAWPSHRLVRDGTEKNFRRAHRELPRTTRHVIEDPIFLDSRASQLVQMADRVAWSANSSLMKVPKHKFAHNWYSEYLAPRDPSRGATRVRLETARPPWSTRVEGVCISNSTGFGALWVTRSRRRCAARRGARLRSSDR
ncbi:DUF3800 domain-containing protein [uncultured Corynebacterium sp.]|uniref:DUF3800 domain-containing protein n=1 Tax=uncultured Corynebacterium sp. TaxID=159447 RepID=UPI00338F4DFE